MRRLRHRAAPLKERFDRLDEACEVVIGLLTKETTTFQGHHYQLTEARCEPKPVQRPHPPLCIGGGGERRTLRTVARFAQHWNVPGGGVDVYHHKLEVLAGHCADIGRDPSEILTSTHLRYEGDLAKLADEAAQWSEAGLGLAIVVLQPPHTSEVLEPIAEALRALVG